MEINLSVSLNTGSSLWLKVLILTKFGEICPRMLMNCDEWFGSLQKGLP